VSATDPCHIERVRVLAGVGLLSWVYAAATEEHKYSLRRATFEIAWPVVFQRLTRPLERQRGHLECATHVTHLAAECVDGFHDAVEAVVGYVLRRSTMPIRELEPWIASRTNAATVDQHRVDRGARGALQRPDPPRWLRRALGEQPWLVELARLVLVWVGIPVTAGIGIWPVDAWADRRAACTGDAAGSDPRAVRFEIERVLAAMRTRPDWYQKYVERPLGHKPAPVAPLPQTRDGRYFDPPALSLVDPHEAGDVAMRELAAAALAELDRRLSRGEHRGPVVLDVLTTVFGADQPVDPGQAPHADTRNLDVEQRLSDPAVLDHVIATVLTILSEPHRDDEEPAGRRPTG